MQHLGTYCRGGPPWPPGVEFRSGPPGVLARDRVLRRAATEGRPYSTFRSARASFGRNRRKIGVKVLPSISTIQKACCTIYASASGRFARIPRLPSSRSRYCLSELAQPLRSSASSIPYCCGRCRSKIQINSSGSGRDDPTTTKLRFLYPTFSITAIRIKRSNRSQRSATLE